MNTKAVKSFGLALMLAAGVLAVLLAMGTFPTQKAAAQVSGTGVSIRPDSADAGAPIILTVGFQVANGAALTAGQEVAITLPGFAVPGTIANSDVSIRSGTSAGNPSDVGVSTTAGVSTVTLTLGNDTAGVPMFITGTSTAPAQVYVTFIKGAGLAAGTTAGNFWVQVDGKGATTGDVANRFDVSPSVSTSHKAGSTSTKLAVSGANFPKGVVDITVVNTTTGDPASCAGSTAGTAATAETFDGIPVKADGSFSVPIEIAVGTGDEEFRYGGNCVFAQHSAGGVEGATDLATDLQPGGKQFDLSAKVTVAAELVRGTDGVEVTVEEADAAAIVTSVSIDGTDVPFAVKVATGQLDPTVSGGTDAANVADTETLRTVGADGEITLIINVKDGDGAALAAAEEATLTVTASASTPPALGTATVAISSLSLQLNPGVVIQGNDVTLTGGGFVKGEVATLTIQSSVETEALDTIESAEEKENVSGNYAFTFKVPDLAPGKATVTLTQDNGQIGVGELTVSTPLISIDPAEGRVGSTVAVEGSGFPARSAVHVTYGGLTDDELTVAKTVGVAIANANGEFSTRFAVPGDATRGSTGNKIQAFRPKLDDNNLQRESNVATHVVPAESVTATPDEGLVGDTITVVGEYYDPGVAVAVKINTATLSETGAVTDANGDFTIEVQIPDLAQRFPVLSVEVGGEPVLSKTIEILEPEPVAVPDSRAPADVLAELIDAGVLGAVWRYNNADGTWLGWLHDDPDLSDDIGDLNVFDSIWVENTSDEDVEWQDQTLYAGRLNQVVVRR